MPQRRKLKLAEVVYTTKHDALLREDIEKLTFRPGLSVVATVLRPRRSLLFSVDTCVDGLVDLVRGAECACVGDVGLLWAVEVDACG